MTTCRTRRSALLIIIAIVATCASLSIVVDGKSNATAPAPLMCLFADPWPLAFQWITVDSNCPLFAYKYFGSVVFASTNFGNGTSTNPANTALLNFTKINTPSCEVKVPAVNSPAEQAGGATTPQSNANFAKQIDVSVNIAVVGSPNKDSFTYPGTGNSFELPLYSKEPATLSYSVIDVLTLDTAKSLIINTSQIESWNTPYLGTLLSLDTPYNRLAAMYDLNTIVVYSPIINRANTWWNTNGSMTSTTYQTDQNGNGYSIPGFALPMVDNDDYVSWTGTDFYLDSIALKGTVLAVTGLKSTNQACRPQLMLYGWTLANGWTLTGIYPLYRNTPITSQDNNSPCTYGPSNALPVEISSDGNRILIGVPAWNCAFLSSTTNFVAKLTFVSSTLNPGFGGWVDFNSIDGSRLTVQSPTVLFTFTAATWATASTTYTTPRNVSGTLNAPASAEPSTFSLNVLPNRIQRRSLTTNRYFIQFAASSTLQVGYYNKDLTVPGKELNPIFLAPANPLGQVFLVESQAYAPCFPGSYRDATFLDETPCALCPVGTYQPSAGATGCLDCGGKTIDPADTTSFYCPIGSTGKFDNNTWNPKVDAYLPTFEASSTIEVFEEVLVGTIFGVYSTPMIVMYAILLLSVLLTLLSLVSPDDLDVEIAKMGGVLAPSDAELKAGWIAPSPEQVLEYAHKHGSRHMQSTRVRYLIASYAFWFLNVYRFIDLPKEDEEEIHWLDHRFKKHLRIEHGLDEHGHSADHDSHSHVLGHESSSDDEDQVDEDGEVVALAVEMHDKRRSSAEASAAAAANKRRSVTIGGAGHHHTNSATSDHGAPTPKTMNKTNPHATSHYDLQNTRAMAHMTEEQKVVERKRRDLLSPQERAEEKKIEDEEEEHHVLEEISAKLAKMNPVPSMIGGFFNIILFLFFVSAISFSFTFLNSYNQNNAMSIHLETGVPINRIGGEELRSVDSVNEETKNGLGAITVVSATFQWDLQGYTGMSCAIGANGLQNVLFDGCQISGSNTLCNDTSFWVATPLPDMTTCRIQLQVPMNSIFSAVCAIAIQLPSTVSVAAVTYWFIQTPQPALKDEDIPNYSLGGTNFHETITQPVYANFTVQPNYMPPVTVREWIFGTLVFRNQDSTSTPPHFFDIWYNSVTSSLPAFFPIMTQANYLTDPSPNIFFATRMYTNSYFRVQSYSRLIQPKVAFLTLLLGLIGIYHLIMFSHETTDVCYVLYQKGKRQAAIQARKLKKLNHALKRNQSLVKLGMEEDKNKRAAAGGGGDAGSALLGSDPSSPSPPVSPAHFFSPTGSGDAQPPMKRTQSLNTAARSQPIVPFSYNGRNGNSIINPQRITYINSNRDDNAREYEFEPPEGVAIQLAVIGGRAPSTSDSDEYQTQPAQYIPNNNSSRALKTAPSTSSLSKRTTLPPLINDSVHSLPNMPSMDATGAPAPPSSSPRTISIVPVPGSGSAARSLSSFSLKMGSPSGTSAIDGGISPNTESVNDASSSSPLAASYKNGGGNTNPLTPQAAQFKR